MEEKYWPEFIRDATYKANRTPIQRLNWRTPIEFITGRRPYLGHLRKILSRAYVHRKDIQKSHKLEERADLGWLMGYEGSNIYCIRIPHKNRVIRSRDAPSDETAHYSGKQSELEPCLQIAIDEILDAIEIPAHEPPQLFKQMNIPDPSPRSTVQEHPKDGCDRDENARTTLPTPRDIPPAHEQHTEINTKIESSAPTQTQQQRGPRDKS